MSSTTLRGLWAHATNSQKLLDTALNSEINIWVWLKHWSKKLTSPKLVVVVMGRWQDMLWHSDPWCGHQLSQHSTLCQGPCINSVTQYNPACRLCNMSDMKEGVKNFCFKQLLLFDPHMHSNCHKAVIIKGSILYRPLHTTHVVWEPEPGGQHRSVGPGPWRRWPVGVTLHGVTAHMWHFVTVTQTCSPCLTYTIILGECWMCSIMISHFRNIKYLARKDPHWHGDA